MRVTAACVDMWEPFRPSIEQWAPNCRIVYAKLHVMQHANRAIDEVRRAEFFRKGPRMRVLVKGKRCLLLTRWVNLNGVKRVELNRHFAMNRKLFKAYLLKESLARLWNYRFEAAMVRYLRNWIVRNWIIQLKWQRLQPFANLAEMLIRHIDGILNYCRTKLPLGVVEAVNGNIKSLMSRGRRYSNVRYLQGSEDGQKRKLPNHTLWVGPCRAQVNCRRRECVLVVCGFRCPVLPGSNRLSPASSFLPPDAANSEMRRFRPPAPFAAGS
jgi:transposase